jgi:hypothetical protein
MMKGRRFHVFSDQESKIRFFVGGFRKVNYPTFTGRVTNIYIYIYRYIYILMPALREMHISHSKNGID